MPSPAIQAFNQKFAQFPELRQQVAAAESVPQLMAVLQQWDCPLTAPEIVGLAQHAYRTWLAILPATAQPFFITVHEDKTLNQAIETCQTPQDAIALAQSHGFDLSLDDLRTAAEAAEQVEGFSFEKLWFKRLGLLA